MLNNFTSSHYSSQCTASKAAEAGGVGRGALEAAMHVFKGDGGL